MPWKVLSLACLPPLCLGGVVDTLKRLYPRLEEHNVTIPTRLGSIMGRDYDVFRVWLGVRYVEPPARFEHSQPKQPWTGVYDATNELPRCIADNGPDGVSEDCLHLQVWTPPPSDAKLPVLVWIHGGGFVQGSGQDILYRATNLVTKKDKPFVYVSINYRLGIFGFFSDKKGANYGFRDQQMALRWVQENIADFGGDPERVTIAGESAGGMSTVLHHVAPGSRGLFHRVFSSSAVGLHYRSLDENANFVTMTAAGLYCHVLHPLTSERDCMMKASPADLDIASLPTHNWFGLVAPCKNCDNWLPWIPSIDGQIIPREPLDMLRDGDFTQVPTVLTSNQNESMMFLSETFASYPDKYEFVYWGIMKVFFQGRSPEVEAFYDKAPDTQADPWTRINIAVTDAGMTCYNRYVARLMSRHAPVYLSHFMHSPNRDFIGGNLDPECNGRAVCHAADLEFLFPIDDESRTMMGANYTKAEEALIRAYSDAFVNVVHGDFKDWIPYDSSNRSLGWYGPKPDVLTGYHDDHCNFLEETGIGPNLWKGGDETRVSISKPEEAVLV